MLRFVRVSGPLAGSRAANATDWMCPQAMMFIDRIADQIIKVTKKLSQN